MRINIFDQSTEIGRSRLQIVQLGVFSFSLAGSSISTLLGVLGFLPMVSMAIGIPVVCVTGILSFFCFASLIATMFKHRKIGKGSDKVVSKKVYASLSNEQTSIKDPRYVSDESLSGEHIR